MNIYQTCCQLKSLVKCLRSSTNYDNEHNRRVKSKNRCWTISTSMAVIRMLDGDQASLHSNTHISMFRDLSRFPFLSQKKVQVKRRKSCAGEREKTSCKVSPSAHHMQSLPFIVILFTPPKLLSQHNVCSVSCSCYKSLNRNKKTARPSRKNQHIGQQKSFIVPSENKRRTSATEGSAQLNWFRSLFLLCGQKRVKQEAMRNIEKLIWQWTTKRWVLEFRLCKRKKTLNKHF